ncbi:MAG TPA: TIGR02594 family protein [Pseudolabrys sp.]|jgi:uncharacterized protein (TIGR02594 family)|nr:TIGR02594 family protein [Pseudolabrys sp.]
MKARKIKVRAARKPVRRRPAAGAAMVAAPKRAMLARLIESPLLSAAAVSLTIFAGSVWLSNPNPPAPKQIDDLAFQHEIDRAVAEGGVSNPLPFVAPAATLAEAGNAARPSRQRPAAHRSDGLGAMAAASGNDLIAEARKYLGRNPTGWSTEWCGRFLDMVLRKTGRKGGGNLARGYLKYGRHLPGPQIGAIAVFSRRGGGHVGIVTGVDSNGNPIVISGNYNDRVAVAAYPASRVLGYVDPN